MLLLVADVPLSALRAAIDVHASAIILVKDLGLSQRVFLPRVAALGVAFFGIVRVRTSFLSRTGPATLFSTKTVGGGDEGPENTSRDDDDNEIGHGKSMAGW
jgi:hypothetical protein